MSDRDDPTAAEISETAKLAEELHFAFLDSSGYYPDRIAVYWRARARDVAHLYGLSVAEDGEQ